MENDEEVKKSLDKLDEISKLRDNWDGYDAEAFSKELIDKCKNIVMNLPVQLEIFPTAGDCIQFEWDFPDNSYIEFNVYKDKTSYFFAPAHSYYKYGEHAVLKGENELEQMIAAINKIFDMFSKETKGDKV